MSPTAYTIGVDMGGTHMRLALMDHQGRCREFRKGSSLGNEPPEVVLQELSKRCIQLIQWARERKGEVLCVGLGVAGKLDGNSGRVIFSPNLPTLGGFPLGKELERSIGIPVIMENDANVFGLGEAWVGKARGIPHWIGITLGTGVGGCFFANGTLWKGDDLGFVGEIGHMIVDPDGPECACGKRGCLEAHASAGALIRGIRDARAQGRPLSRELVDALERNTLDAAAVHRAAEAGDEVSRELFSRMGWALGLALANLFTFLGISTAVIGGGVSAGWSAFAPSMEKTLGSTSSMLDPDRIHVHRSSLGDMAALYGAARLAWDRVRELNPRWRTWDG